VSFLSRDEVSPTPKKDFNQECEIRAFCVIGIYKDELVVAPDVVAYKKAYHRCGKSPYLRAHFGVFRSVIPSRHNENRHNDSQERKEPQHKQQNDKPKSQHHSYTVISIGIIWTGSCARALRLIPKSRQGLSRDRLWFGALTKLAAIYLFWSFCEKEGRSPGSRLMRCQAQGVGDW